MSDNVIVTKRGDEFLVDENMYEFLNGFCWHSSVKGKHIYAQRKVWVCGKEKGIYLHRVVASAMRGQYVDHVNGNTFDNRLSNLRVCTNQQNVRHRTSLNENNKTGVIGVSFHQPTNKWRSGIMIDRKNIHLGVFDYMEDAIAARRRAERIYFGEFTSEIQTRDGQRKDGK